MSLEEVCFPIELPQGRPFQVVGFGENAVDWVCRVPHFPEHDTKVKMERILRLGGGQIATASSACARFGLKTRYVGRCGDDDMGEFLRRDLAEEPMDIVLETVPGASSHLSLIIVDRPTGGRTIVWDRDPHLQYGAGELKRDPIVQGQILHIDGDDIQASIQAARWAQEAGMKVSLDIDRVREGVEELLPLIDFLLPNMAFVVAYSGCGDWRIGLRRLGKVGRGFVGVTRGDRGCAFLWEDEIFEFPAFDVRVVDSTGAGDVFHSAFIYGVFQGWPVGRILRFSNAAGALACIRLGARTGIPSLKEVEELCDTGVMPQAAIGGAVSK